MWRLCARAGHPVISNVKRRRLIHVIGLAVRGGCEINCENFIRYSPEWDHQVIVLGEPGPMTPIWENLGAEVLHLRLLGSSWPAFYLRLRRLFRSSPAEGFILWAGIRVPLVLAAIGARRPAVLHAGNPYSIQPLKGAGLALLIRILGRPEKVTVIACTDHVAETFRRSFYGRMFPIRSVPNAVVCPVQNPYLARKVLRTDKVYLGMVARLDPIKDHATAIRATALLRRDWPNACLLLAGDGISRGRLEGLVRELALQNSVCFRGLVIDVPAFLRELDVFCYATGEQEGMGIALAEAMAGGLPCVVTDLPAMREVVGEPPAAVLAAHGDAAGMASAMAGVLDDLERRRSLSRAAWNRAREAFSPEVFVNRYLEALGQRHV
jgi:glycosyltransferase involved in cell wall biosynthesis